MKLLTLKKFLGNKKSVFYMFSVLFLTMCCIVGVCCHVEKDIQYACDRTTETETYIANTGLKCRQCGKNLKHKGFFLQ